MDTFCQLLRLAISDEAEMPISISKGDWPNIYAIARRHSILGVLFGGVEKLRKDQLPPKNILYKWIGAVAQIESNNNNLNIASVEVSDMVRRAGFRNVILKGQGNALYYPRPSLRTPGDIDIWLEGTRNDILRYVKSLTDTCIPLYHHVSVELEKYTNIEIHFMPSWMNDYFTNRRLQSYFRRKINEQMSHAIDFYGLSGDICVPTLSFNRVYLLVHIYRHLFHEGITLKQLIDYFYLLKKGFSEEEKSETLHELKRLGMLRFTSAVMYIMHDIFGLSSHLLLIQPNKKRGMRLLNELMLHNTLPENNSETRLHKFYRRTRRNFGFACSYPQEVVSSPLFTIWHFLWRKTNNY